MSSKTRTAKRAIQRKMFGGFPLSDDGLPIYKTSRGIEVECQPIAAEIDVISDNIRAAIDWPKVPTYTATFAGDEKEDFEYDEKSITGDDVPEEDRQAWADYLTLNAACTEEYDRRVGEAHMRVIATDGIKALNAPPEEEWTSRREWQGFNVPDNPLERQLHYFLTAIVGNINDDMLGIYKGIALASGRSAEEVAQIETLFRTQVGQDGGSGEPDAAEGAGDPAAGEKGVVVEQS